MVEGEKAYEGDKLSPSWVKKMKCRHPNSYVVMGGTLKKCPDCKRIQHNGR